MEQNKTSEAELKNENNAQAPSRAELKAEIQKKKAAEKKAQAEAKKAKARESAKKKAELKAAKKAKKKERRAAKGPSVLSKIADKIATVAAAPIFLHDRVQAATDKFFYDWGYSIVSEYHDARVRYKGTSAKIIKGLFALVVLVCATMLTMEHYTVYEYAYNGRVLGYVKSQESVVGLLSVAGDRLSENNSGAHIKFKADDNVTFRRVSSTDRDVDNPDTVINKLTYMQDVEVSAYGIYEDGKLQTVVETKRAAEDTVKAVMDKYRNTESGMKIEKISFEKPVEVKPVEVMLTSVQGKGTAKKQLTEGGTITLGHIIKADETRASVASKYNVKLEDITSIKATKENVKLKSGDAIQMEKTISPLKVVTVESGKMSEAIPFETQENETSDLFKGESKVDQEGEEGRQIISGKITKVNGKEVKRDIKHKEVVKEPIPRIVRIGTNDKPKTASSGKFSTPIKDSYTINALGHFGMRWGRMHSGIDFTCPTGTPIYAADGGVVTKSSTYGGYGNCIVIRHDNGNETVYGHCSTLNASVGEKVYKGQIIARVGNTGRSTGAHLHFEIRVGGKPVDPAGYIF